MTTKRTLDRYLTQDEKVLRTAYRNEDELISELVTELARLRKAIDDIQRAVCETEDES